MSEGKKVFLNGTPLECTHCGGHHFDRRAVQLPTRGLSFFKLEWLYKSTTVFVCVRCGRLEWFLDANET